MFGLGDATSAQHFTNKFVVPIESSLRFAIFQFVSKQIYMCNVIQANGVFVYKGKKVKLFDERIDLTFVNTQFECKKFPIDDILLLYRIE